MRNWTIWTAAVTFSLAVAVYACDTKVEKTNAQTVANSDSAQTGTANPAATSHAGCGKGAAVVATGAATDATTVSAPAAKSGCCGKAAATVASTAKGGCCGKGAALASAGGCAKSCGGKKLAPAVAERVERAMATLPAMTYKVGELNTPCFMTATAKAEETKTPVQFVVSGQTFDNRDAASVALAEALTERAETLRHISFVAGDKSFHCPMSAAEVAKKEHTSVKYQLAGFDFDCKDRADAVAKAVEEAAAKVAMTYKADGQPVACPKSCQGKMVTYVVGDQETGCEKSAKLLLAQYLVRTIIETAAGAL